MFKDILSSRKIRRTDRELALLIQEILRISCSLHSRDLRYRNERLKVMYLFPFVNERAMDEDV